MSDAFPPVDGKPRPSGLAETAEQLSKLITPHQVGRRCHDHLFEDRWPPCGWRTPAPCPLDGSIQTLTAWIATARARLNDLVSHAPAMEAHRADLLHDCGLLMNQVEGDAIELVKQFALELAGDSSDARPATARSKQRVRDPKMDARDKWLYEQCCGGGNTFKKIVAALKIKAPKEGWRLIQTVQGIRLAASKYAKRNRLDPIPPRQDL